MLMKMHCKVAVTRHCCIWHQSMTTYITSPCTLSFTCCENFALRKRFRKRGFTLVVSFFLSPLSGSLCKHCKKRMSLLGMQLTGHPLQKNWANWKSRSVSPYIVCVLVSDGPYLGGAETSMVLRLCKLSVYLHRTLEPWSLLSWHKYKNWEARGATSPILVLEALTPLSS